MNAMEAMSSASKRHLVIITQNIDEAQVQVTVEDSGTGLDPKTMARIFDAFYTTKPGGMGMGLSICRSIVHNHGGRLWATGNEGPGTSFHFILPREGREDTDARCASV
jgi:signal transduction histidine kinase